MLVIEPEPATARRMIDAMGRRASGAPPLRRAADHLLPPLDGEPECLVIGSLRELHELGLENVELVICSVYLRDGTGLDALEFLRVRAPQVPVILVGTPEDASLAVEAIRSGARDFLTTAGLDLQSLPLAVEKCLVQERVRHENQRLHRDLGESLAELAVKNQQLQALVRQLETSARSDDLTGLCNRRWFNEMLQRLWQQAARNQLSLPLSLPLPLPLPLALMMIDLDDFKVTNDLLGHLRGDQALRQAGRIIQSNCRQVDLPARFGGDEFCVLMPECEPRQAEQVTLRLLREVSRAAARRPPGEPRLGMSVGVAHVALSRPADPQELIRHADEALYAAKAAGKGRAMIRAQEGARPIEERASAVEIGEAVGASW